MGNQGTKNWKLGAFFAVSLMLIAGLFSNAAIAGDGDGMITVGWGEGGSGAAANLEVDSNGGDPPDGPLAAAATEQGLKFTYTVPAGTNMSGGMLQILIPSGWTPVKIAENDPGTDVDDTTLFQYVTISDNDNVTLLSTSDTVQTSTVLTDTEKAENGSVTTLAADKIEVALGTNWSDGGTLTITLGNVTVDTPSSLAFIKGPNTQPYASYQFTTRSSGKGGILTRLKPTTDEDGNPVDPQPRVRVSNIIAGSGAVTIEPTVSYEGEEVTFAIAFKATGPMYDWDDNLLTDGLTTDSDIEIRIPTPGDGVAAPVENDPKVSLSRTRGSVRFEAERIAVSSDGVITINISRMNKGNEVHITYGPVTIADGIADFTASDHSPSASVFEVRTRTDGTSSTSAADNALAADNVTGGRTQAEEGSGTVTLSPDVVDAGETNRTFTLTYKADTKLTGNLVITVGGGIDPDDPSTEITADTPAETDLMLSTTSGDYAYVSSPDSDITPTFIVDATTPTITWTNITVEENASFRTVIGKVNVSEDTGTYPWTATIIDDTTDLTANFYVIETEPDSVRMTANTESSSIAAASETTITFTFSANDTPIRNGSVRFIIPSSWTKPDKTEDKPGSITGAEADDISISSVRTGYAVTVAVKDLGRSTVDTPSTLEIKYNKAVVQSNTGTVSIPGFFRASSGSPERSAGSVEIEVTNVADGGGTATISPTSVRAGSANNEMLAIFTAKGTMNGGSVSFQIPEGWGDMQRDPLKRNYIRVTTRGGSLVDTDYGNKIVIANLNTLRPGGTVTFIYGGGTGSRANRGAAADTETGISTFTIQSDGNGDGTFMPVTGDRELDDAVKETNPDGLGEAFTGADNAGMLRVKITGAADGTGTAKVDTVETKAGTQTYKDEQGEDVQAMRIHAGDDSTYLEFTYTPGQTIEEGQLMFTVPGGWSNPQGEDPGAAGYTRVYGGEPAQFDGEGSLTVDIIRLDKSQTIAIHYGEYQFGGTEGGAIAPAVATASSRFAISVRGTKDGVLTPIDPNHRDTVLDVKVWSQASGGGMAMIAVTDDIGELNAGDMGRELTITYTASGELKNGALKVTTPDGWSAPMMANVNVTGSTGAPDFGGDYEADNLPEGLGAMDVIVEGVNLDARETVTFVYSNVTVQPTAATGVAFEIKSMGSEGPGSEDPGTDFNFIGLDDLTVDVGEAAAGSGMAMVDPMFVTAGTSGNTLTFTYTVAGEATYPRDIRIAVPAGWSMPSDAAAADANKGTYTVTLMRDSKAVADVVQEIAPIDGSMVARVQAGSEGVDGGDMVVFEYQNADAPAAPERSMFTVSFDGTEVDSSPVVAVVSGEAVTQLGVSVSGDISVDTGNSVTVTVMLQDANGDETGTTTDLDVTLTSSSAMGSFSMTADGDAMDMVTILAGSSSAMVYYSDSAIGTTTITASAADLASGMATVMVTTDVVEITSVMVDPMVAMAGSMVTVSAMGTPGKEAMFSVGSIVTDKAMTEGESGSYSGYFTVVVDQHADGMYNVTVSLNGESMMAANQLTIDSTEPMVTASASPATAANGDMVTITAMVEDAGEISSVMANVSMLDSTQTEMVALTMADGSYSGSFTISDENEAENGMQEITVTAMDAAGNSGMGTAMVELKNELVYTSMIPADISLFHVPLDVEGLDTVSDLAEMLGDAVSLVITRDTASGSWESDSSDVMITADLGIVLSMKTAMEVTFTGSAWGDGTSMISVMEGQNLIGLPLNDSRVSKVSDIMDLFDEGVVIGVVVSDEGTFRSVIRVDDPGDNPVAGDASYLVTANADATAMVMGEGWSNGGGAAAAPIALIGHKVDNQTPVLLAEGSVVDELTGLAKEGFRVKVKNLSTRTSLSSISQSDAENGYDMTFVNLTTGNAARVGDVLEISADSPNPLIGIQPLRHIITVNDVRNSRIQLENLIAYEIPAETELLRNYPNPFNPETWIPFRLAEDAVVTLTIYDTAGRVVRGIDIGHQPAAVYETRAKAIYWDGRNDFGEQVASGIYFYNLSAGEEFSGTRKMLILK